MSLMMRVATVSLTVLFLIVPVAAAPPTAPEPDQPADDAQAKAQKVKDALDACKADAAKVKDKFDGLGDTVTGKTVRGVLGGIMGKWSNDVDTLQRTTMEWGERPKSRTAISQLVSKVDALKSSIDALPKNKPVSVKRLKSLQLQQAQARQKQDEVSGVLEPIMHR